MTVLIAGGGIGDLGLGLMLGRAGIRFRIFEAVPSLRMPGLGLLLRPDSVQVLTDLDLGAQLTLIGLPMTQVTGVTVDGIVTETAPAAAPRAPKCRSSPSTAAACTGLWSTDCTAVRA